MNITIFIKNLIILNSHSKNKKMKLKTSEINLKEHSKISFILFKININIKPCNNFYIYKITN